MNSRSDIQRELESTNSSLPFDVHMPVFDLPQGYFENFAAVVLATIKAQTADAAGELAGLSPLLAGMPKSNPYSLPENYFNKVIVPADTQHESPQPGWYAAGRTTPYSVPAGYFEAFPKKLLQQVAARPARVVSMFARPLVRYAAAAVVVGVLAVGAWMFRSNGADTLTEPDQWVASQLKGVSNQELEAFISGTDFGAIAETTAQTTRSEADVRKLLKDVPSSELDAFLNEVPLATEQIN